MFIGASKHPSVYRAAPHNHLPDILPPGISGSLGDLWDFSVRVWPLDQQHQHHLVTNASSQAPSRPTESETQGMGLHSVLTSPRVRIVTHTV